MNALSKSELIEKFQNLLNQPSKTPVHAPFVEGDQVIGIYVRDEVQVGPYGLTPIIVIEQGNGKEIGVKRSVYIDNAIAISQAKPGHLVSISCTGREYNDKGYEYPVLDVTFLNPNVIKH